MSNKHDVHDYDWAMYVDASGDDGFSFDHGSSPTYTVNSFMCETNHISYNQDILRKVKSIARCAPQNEMKSSTIIKSKKRGEICDTLSLVKGMIFQFVIFKQCIDPSSFSKEEIEKHFFSTIAHGFTIGMAASFHYHFNKSVCIVVDNMKAEEILGTKEIVEKNLKDVKHAIIFADSKSTTHSLLQVSDYFAGLTNKACAIHEEKITANPSINRCSACGISRALCRRNPRSIQTPLFYDIQRYVNLFSIWSDKESDMVMGNGIRMAPENFDRRYRFFDCVLHTPSKRT